MTYGPGRFADTPPCIRTFVMELYVCGAGFRVLSQLARYRQSLRNVRTLHEAEYEGKEPE